MRLDIDKRRGAAPRPIATVPTPRLAALAIVLATVAAIGCGAEPATDAFLVADSAGVRIATSFAARWDTDGTARWTVGTEPTLDLSMTGTGPEHEFYRVADALRLSDGTIVVANTGSFQVRSYATDGVHVASVGREGEGPGEFARFFGIDRFAGDSIMAHTWPTRVTVLGPDLNLARTFDAPPLVRRIQTRRGGLVAMIGDPADLAPETNTFTRPPEAVVWFDTSGGPLDTLLAIEGAEVFFFASEFGMSGGIPLFSKRTVVTAFEGGLITGLADSLSYSVYAEDGELSTVVRVPGYDLVLSDADVDAELQARVGPNPSPFVRDMHDALPRPATRAAYEEILVATTGHVWASTQPSWTDRLARAPLDWNVFTPEGEWLGAVTMPGRFQPFEIGEDYVLGVYFDDLDVEHVQLVPLNK